MRTEMVQLPIGEESNFEGVVDLIQLKAYYFDGEGGGDMQEREIPEGMAEKAQEYRNKLLETLSDENEELMEKLLEEQEIDPEFIKKVIREQTINLSFSPVFCGSAYKNKGVQNALDGVIDYLPSPVEKKNNAFTKSRKDGKEVQEEIELECDDNKQFVCLAFKLEENRFGQLTYCRVYQGKVKVGDMLYNMATKQSVKVNRMVKMHANDMEDIKEASSGDIFALFGIECASGTTFIKQKNVNSKQPTQMISLSSMYVPDPVLSLSLYPKSNKNSEKLIKALKRFMREDPTFNFNIDTESEELVISGMGELHLQIYVERLRREYKIECDIGQPIVNYRETLTGPVSFDYLHKKQSGGAGQFAKVIGNISPMLDIAEEQNMEELFQNQFLNKLQGMNIPTEFITAIEKQFYESCNKGPLTGYPIINCRFELHDGQTHVVDSSQNAFQNATKGAIRKVFESSEAVLMEPLMKVFISVPAENYQPIMNMVTKRGGDI
jgi:elongation factor G